MSERSLKLFEGVAHIDDDLIESALSYRPASRQKRRRMIVSLAAAAAVLAVVILAGVPLMSKYLPDSTMAPTSPAAPPPGMEPSDPSSVSGNGTTCEPMPSPEPSPAPAPEPSAPEPEAPESSEPSAPQESIPASEKKLIIGYVDYPYYNSLRELAEKADYIIFGTVMSKKYEWMSLRIEDNSDEKYLDPGGDADNGLTLVTIFDVNVANDYKAAASTGGVIKVLVLGGETEDTIYKIDGSPEIRIDEKYIFFLSKGSTVDNGAWLLNDTQSLYLTDGDTISSVTKDGFELSFEALDKLME